MGRDLEKELQECVFRAHRESTPLAIRGGGSKDFYGREITGETLSTKQHGGILDYHPTELVITARAGTSLEEIQTTLADQNQMLGFEPPLFSPFATLGGAIATGLAGPRRPYAGSVSDFVLGMKVLTGKGEILRFGGQVIKNVAGFDVSRLMVGAMGCLGVILEVSLKVLPGPLRETTVRLEHERPDESLELINSLARKPLPVSAACWIGGVTRLRLSGSDAGVDSATRQIGGEVDDQGAMFWDSVRQHSHEFFQNSEQVVRGSVAPATPVNCPQTPQLIDWGGAVRWVCGDQDKSGFDQHIRSHRGHVTRFRNADRAREVFDPIDPAMMKYHQRLKNAFDPDRILNPGRMYADL